MDELNTYLEIIDDNLRRLQSDETGEDARPHIVAIFEAFVDIMTKTDVIGDQYRNIVGEDLQKIIENANKIKNYANYGYEMYNQDVVTLFNSIKNISEEIPTNYNIFHFSLVDDAGEALLDSDGNTFEAVLPCFYEYV